MKVLKRKIDQTVASHDLLHNPWLYTLDKSLSYRENPTVHGFQVGVQRRRLATIDPDKAKWYTKGYGRFLGYEVE
jgi:hypothetical protein